MSGSFSSMGAGGFSGGKTTGAALGLSRGRHPNFMSCFRLAAPAFTFPTVLAEKKLAIGRFFGVYTLNHYGVSYDFMLLADGTCKN